MNYQDAMNTVADLNQRAEALYQQALTAQIAKARKDKTMREWLGFQFRASSGLTPEFAAFFSQYRATIARLLGPDYDLNLRRGHQDVHGFARHRGSGRYVHLSCSQVCYFQDGWYQHILIRTAENERDYTGGQNHYTDLPQVKAAADALIYGEVSIPIPFS